MKEFNAAIFDLDGVIVDTAKYHFYAWKRLAQELGFEFTSEDNERQKGVSRMESLGILLEVGGLHFSHEEKLKLAEKKNQWYVEYISQIGSSEILSGVYEYINRIREQGIKTALASASKNTPLILDRLNIVHLFDVIVDGNCVSKAKPDPEVFLKAAEQLNVLPSRCVVFEDSTAGVEGAIIAGMYTVGIGSKKILTKANLVVSGFSESSLIHELQCLFQDKAFT